MQQQALLVNEERKGDTRVLKLEGSFNRESARMLRELLEQWPEELVVLDFSRVHDFLVLAVAEVTRGLESRAVQVSGLAQVHERIFRCFGWLGSKPDNPTYYVPEDVPLA